MPTSQVTRKRRRSQRSVYTVVNMPPPWKRSLTESGMSRRTTDFDRIVVALFFLALLGMCAWLALSAVA